MTKETAVKLWNAAKRLGYNKGNGGEVSLYKNYSGRGMYGKTTIGFVMPHIGFLLAMAAEARVKKADKEDFCEELRKVAQDSMGRDIIVY
jgi:hypothetical protein